MVTKKIEKKAAPAKEKVVKEKVEKAEKVVKEKVAKVKEISGKYFYAVGKRKTSVAQVRIYPAKEATIFNVNEKEMKKYFPIERLQMIVESPITSTGNTGKFNVSVKVVGGGVNSQAESARLGIARALIIFDETLRKSLKDLGFLTRDPRKKERKKYGRKGARKRFQF